MVTVPARPDRELAERVTRAVEGGAARLAFGEPVVRGDVTLVPAARIMATGGMGGGSVAAPAGGDDPGANDAGRAAGDQQGGGGGGLLTATPVGAYVIKDGEVRWRPALNVNRVVLGGQIVGAVALLTAGVVLRQYLRRAHRG